MEPRSGPRGRCTIADRVVPPTALRRAAVGVAVALALVSCSDGGSAAQRTGQRAPATTGKTAGASPGTGPADPIAATSSENTPPTTASSTTTPPPPTTEPAPTTPPGPPPLANEPGDLAAGTRGLRTKALQQKLNELRFDVGEPDGSFGTSTQAAVWAWQALAGLPVDGVVNQATYDVILASMPTGMLHPELGPTHVEVDLDRQVLLAFRDGQLDLVTHVSSGSGVPYCETDPRDGSQNCGDALTPPGTFTFGRRAAGWEIGPLGGLYNPIYFNGGIAVHGAESVPGHPASHGCVRLPMHIAEYFPTKVNTGEAVIVFNSR